MPGNDSQTSGTMAVGGFASSTVSGAPRLSSELDDAAAGRRRSSLHLLKDQLPSDHSNSLRGAATGRSTLRRSSVDGDAVLPTARDRRRSSLGLGLGLGSSADSSHHGTLAAATANSRARSAIYEHLSANIEAIQRDPGAPLGPPGRPSLPLTSRHADPFPPPQRS